jgi:hypothetical protein
MLSPKVNSPLVTSSDAEDTLHEWLSLARKLDEVKKGIDKQERRLNALMEFIDPANHGLIAIDDDLSGHTFSLADYAKHKVDGGLLPAKIADDDVSFPATLTRIVKRAGTGMTHRQVMDEVLKTDFAERVSQDGAKRYYTDMGRLFKSTALVRHGDLIYAPNVYETLKQAGALAPESRFKRAGSTQQIVELLEQSPTGLSPVEVKEKLIELDEANRKKFSGQYIYNCLSRLAKEEVIVRADSKYYPAQKAKPRGNVASGANASGEAR